ncbi:Protein arginine N-methyltransferase 2 [Nibea albiflora]|uniref:Protein arginine N-methyltransferase 2 n=1 Tax=Nibea albiflora TaxID=240163 RepID=A0ACB7EFX6_NIBAL|nr:Protein arginine N-methyltransferase 2 [Nibea albiflora]
MKKRFNINLDDSAFTKERIPPKPQFQSSSKGGQNTPAEPVDQPLSYADFIIQSKSNVAAPPQREAPSKPLRTEAAAATNLKQSESASVSSATEGCETVQDCAKWTEGVKKNEDTQVQKEGNGQRLDPSMSLGPKQMGSGSSIIVSPRQRGNPILKFVRSVPWEFGDVVPDYVLGQTTCALFLSLRYHNLNPNYIHDRLKLLGQTFTLRVLLIQVDVKDPHHALKELARICIMADCTLILAWSPEEAGRYLETYKSYEKKPADLLKEQVEKDYLSKRLHLEMLSDKSRTEAYRQVILSNSASLRNKVVMDLGCGTGIISLFCAQLAQPSVVYAVEASSMSEYTRQLVKQNGCEEVITVLQGRAEELELPEQVDILVSEWMGNCLLFEFMVESVLLARDRWLREGGVMWPSSAALTLVPCQADSYYAEKMAFWERPYGLDFTPLQPLAQQEFFTKPKFSHLIEPNDCLAAPCKEIKGQFHFCVEKSGVFHGFTAWFTVHFESLETGGAAVELNTGPNSE